MIEKVSRLFGGGGAHSRAGGAFTKKTFQEVGEQITEYFSKPQKKLFEF
ncbi:MAG: hypothetical protein J4478_02495 [Candidatus Diapherotrites archaeon]|uniref:DHHA1 domain-containing protein n=1 Tax=Candidatus Iainarchaeum sp. TaxID=3101447 RepID=A0A7J4KTP0_9ARCH|nr:MAG: hypothetical protein QT12_C0007G0023 [archaeon GW2011_AR21]MBS3058248.1 hypothetical protein [Candidatus Diapherotrites archaeon]HIH21917.1 hypothetical protein [Candidatus Diapherotrites archaeon]HIH33381.1 hypothetical protein [Candidatus Diapherotrites archaeon]